MSTFDEERGAPDTAAPGGENVEQLEHEAARTRAELGDTVDALTARLDVKSRARHELDARRARAQQGAANVRRAVTDRDGKPLPQVWAAGAAVLVAVVGVPLAVRMMRSRSGPSRHWSPRSRKASQRVRRVSRRGPS